MGATINIDKSVNCPECGKPGASIGSDGIPGRCLDCANKYLAGLTTKIGPNVTGKMLAMIANLFTTYENDMDQAYRQADEDPFKISIGLKLEPGDRGIDIEASISFVTGRVKDKTTGTASEAQQNLFKEA